MRGLAVLAAHGKLRAPGSIGGDTLAIHFRFGNDGQALYPTRGKAASDPTAFFQHG